MRTPSPYAVGTDAGKVNVAVMRPTVNIKESENLGEQAQAVTGMHEGPIFSRHGTFGPKKITHPGLE